MALADLNIRIGATTKALDDGLSAADRRLRSFGRKMTDLGAQLSTTFSAAFAAMGVASVKAFGDFERLEKGLGAVTKSVVPVNQQIDRLKTLAESPGLGFEQAVTASTRLQAVGFSAEFAEKTIKEVANAVATTGGNADNFDSVLKQFTQMIAKGKLLQEDLGIIQENMPIVSQAIEKAFGTNNVERIRATGVSAQEFVQKVVGELGGLKRVEGGLSNSLDNLGQSVRFFFVSVGKEINEAFNLQSLIDGLGSKLNRLAEWFASLDENVQRNIIRFGVFLAAVGPVLFIIGKMAAVGQVVILGFRNLIGVVKGLGTAFAFLASPVGIVIAAVAALAVAGIYLVKNWDSTKAAFQNIWIGIKNFFLKTINAILKGVDQFVEAATFGVASSNIAEKFSFKTEDYVDVPKWKSFGDTMKEVGGDLLQYAGLAGKAKKETKELNNALFLGDTAPNITGGDTASGGKSDAEKEFDKLRAEKRAFQAELKNNPIQPFQNTISDISSVGGQASVGAAGFNIQLAERYANAIQLATDKHSLLKNEVGSLAKEALPALDVALNSTQERAIRYIESLKNLNDGIASVIRTGLTDLAVGFGEFLGDLVSKTEDSKNFAAVLLTPIAGALESLGKLAISTGVAVLGIRKALESLNPGVAIAAGIALVGLAKLVKNQASKLSAPKLAKGGLAYGETLAIVGDNPNASNDPEVIAPLSKLRSYIDGSSGGGGYSEIFLRGEDLVLAMERTNSRRTGRIK
jgi:tape measure domain-containing protein